MVKFQEKNAILQCNGSPIGRKIPHNYLLISNFILLSHAHFGQLWSPENQGFMLVGLASAPSDLST